MLTKQEKPIKFLVLIECEQAVKKWVWEKERETSEPWVDGRWSWWWWVTFALGWAETEGWCAPPVWSVIQILTVTMTCQPWHALPLPLITSLSWCHHAQCHHGLTKKERERDLIVIFSFCTEKNLDWWKWKMFSACDYQSALWMCHGFAPPDHWGVIWR